MNVLLATIIGGVVVGLILYYVFGIGKERKTFSSRFSSSQKIKILPPSLGGVDHLDLDNTSTLHLGNTYDMNHVTLTLNSMPVIELPLQSNDEFKIEGLKIIGNKNENVYTFSTYNNTQKIKTGNRLFVVTLKKISKMNVKDVPNAIEYDFGITEE